MATATQLTVSDAAKKVGVSRQTIFKQIKAGKLSATLSHDGTKQVDVSELLRVYGRLLSPDEVAKKVVHRAQQSSPELATAALQLELERAKMQLQMKDFELHQMRERVAELKTREQQANEERLRVFGLLEQQTRLLAAPVPAKTSARPKPKAIAKPKTLSKVTVAKAPEKPATARKTTPKPAAKKATAKPMATKPSTTIKSQKVVKKATRK